MKGRTSAPSFPERRREDRERADAVAVVIAEDDDAPAAPGRRGEELHGGGQPRHRERVVQRVRRRSEVRARGLDVLEPARRQDARRRRGQAELPGETSRRVGMLGPKVAPHETRRARPGVHAFSQAPMARNFA